MHARASRARQHRKRLKVTRPENSDKLGISLAELPPTVRQRRFVLVAGVLLFAIFAILVPFADKPLPELDAFIPVSVTVMLVSDLITSVLLYAQCSLAPSRSLLLLASGYLFTALLIIPHALAYPGAFTAVGLIGGKQTAPWLFFATHFSFAVVLLTYARLKKTDHVSALRPSLTRPAIHFGVAAAVGCACTVALLATVGEQYLPAIVADETHTVFIHLSAINAVIIAVTAAALVEIYIRRHNVLDYWLILICAALIQEQSLFFLGEDRWTLGFYAGRIIWLITSTVVLILLLLEITKLYAICTRSYRLLERERNNKLLNAQAIIAAIAHELRQPLTAIIASGHAAQEYLKKTPPATEKAQLSLGKVIREGHRTGDVFDGIHALFKSGDQKWEPVDLNEIVISALESLHAELMDHGITTLREFGDLPLIGGNGNQLQQVVFNLVHNAFEALQVTANGRRLLRVTTEHRGDASVAIVVEDTGPGIDSAQLDSIFNAFVTTKPNGMGLGLAICRQIVEHHGGKLVASCGNSGGARFQVVLPTGQPSARTLTPDASFGKVSR
jgi:signal transduction histidine kinase